MNFPKKPLSRKAFFCIVALPTALLLVVSCSVLWLGQTGWEPPVLVSITGQDGCIAMYWHGVEIFSPVQKGRAFSFPVRDDELLFTSNEGFVPYRRADGRSLNFSGDKARTALNGSTVSLNLSREGAWKWLNLASPEELKGLRLLNIEDKLNAQQIARLQNVAEVNPGVGLWIPEYEAWRDIAGMFDPAWLMISGLVKQDLNTLLKMKSIRTLGLDNPGHALDFLSKMPGLQTLIIHDWDPQRTGPLPDNLPPLRHIILVKPDMVDLAPLGRQPGLMELDIHESKTLADLALLKQFPQLRLLSLHDSTKALGLGPLKDLRKMKWLSLPDSTTQEQLAGIVQGLPDLVFLDLSDCEKATDLTPVQSLAGLHYLIVNKNQASSDLLFKMKHLKWLAVAGKKDEVQEKWLTHLQEALPDTDVVRLVPFCLGSGWILLLLPAIALSWWVAVRRRRMHPFGYNA